MQLNTQRRNVWVRADDGRVLRGMEQRNVAPTNCGGVRADCQECRRCEFERQVNSGSRIGVVGKARRWSVGQGPNPCAFDSARRVSRYIGLPLLKAAIHGLTAQYRIASAIRGLCHVFIPHPLNPPSPSAQRHAVRYHSLHRLILYVG